MCDEIFYCKFTDEFFSEEWSRQSCGPENSVLILVRLVLVYHYGTADKNTKQSNSLSAEPEIEWLLAGRLSVVNPVPFDRVVNAASVCIKPYIVRYWTTDFNDVVFYYKPLKHFINILVCNDR